MKKEKKIVAIHQPNFFPWLGYFDKITKADKFVFLDNVQFPKKGGTWSNRVMLSISKRSHWVTAAVDRSYSGTKEIRDMKFLSENPWRSKIIKSIEINYIKHPYFKETMNFIEPLVLNEERNIAKYNIHSITEISRELGIKIDKMICSSDLNTNSSSNNLLCEITKLSGGENYMCGGGADGYQDQKVFNQQGVNLIYQNFIHPIYNQYKTKNFISGLSIIDALMNMGWSGVKKILI